MTIQFDELITEHPLPMLDLRGDLVAGAEPVFAEVKRKHYDYLRRLHGH